MYREEKIDKGLFETRLENLCLMMENSAERFGENTALIFLNRRMRYTELRERVHRMAAAFESMGIAKGDRVAIMLPNTPELVIAYFAALTCGAVVVMCNPLYTVREITNQLKGSPVAVLVTLDLFWPRAREVNEKKLVDRVVLTTLGPYLSGLKKILYPAMRRFKGKVHFPHGREAYFFDHLLDEFPADPGDSVKRYGGLHDPAMIQYTAGTTGVPQGAVLTHYNLLKNAVQVARWFPALEVGNERMLAVLPFFHIFGLTVCLNMIMLTGGTIILVPRFSGKAVDKLLDVIVKHKPTLFPAVPTIYSAINNFGDIDRYDLSSIKFCISGAAPLPEVVQTRFQELTGSVLVEGYGLSEASPVTHCNPLDRERNRIGSIGLPLSETFAGIVDPGTDEALDVGEVGELVIRGPQVMRGYWNNETETARAIRNGWLHTGDLAKKDRDGYYYIVDRIKDLIIVGGFNVYPREVEEVLYSYPKVSEAAVVGVPDEYKGEVVKAYVVLRKGEKAAVEEIKAFCRQFLSPYKVPRVIEFKDELPKSIIGKVLKKDLKE